MISKKSAQIIGQSVWWAIIIIDLRYAEFSNYYLFTEVFGKQRQIWLILPSLRPNDPTHRRAILEYDY